MPKGGIQTAVSSLLVNESANNKFAIWGHSYAKGERESRRHYAIKPSHRSNFRNQQLASLSLTSRAVLDLEGALAECNRAHDFLAFKSSDIPDDPSLYVKSKLRYFAEHLATVNGGGFERQILRIAVQLSTQPILRTTHRLPWTVEGKFARW